MSRVTVIGAGFAALTAVRKLRAADADLGIDLIAPSPEFVYYPGTIWIPTGLREPADLVIPLENFFRRMNVTYHQAAATGPARRWPGGGHRPGRGAERRPDHRLRRSLHPQTAGYRTFLTCRAAVSRSRPGFAIACAEMDGGTLAFGFSGNPKEPSAMRGGPVFEFLFGIDSWLRKQGRRDKFKLVFFHAGGQTRANASAPRPSRV